VKKKVEIISLKTSNIHAYIQIHMTSSEPQVLGEECAAHDEPIHAPKSSNYMNRVDYINSIPTEKSDVFIIGIGCGSASEYVC
jgi:hypothetical protein